MKPVLVIHNDVREGAGQLDRLLLARGFEQNNALGWEVDYAMLKPGDFSGLVVLGGAQSVYEAEAYPYLRDEINLIRSFVDAGIAVIGICLGAQLLATALGGKVQPNVSKELGWHDLTINEEGRRDGLMCMQPETALAFHFHGDFFTLPPACVCLASSAMTGCQLFRYKENVYGFQYHAEVDQDLIEVMCMSNIDYMAEDEVDAYAVIDQSKKLIADYMQATASILNAWIDFMDEAA